MRKKNGGKDVTALCRVYHGLTYEQEAELYYRLDRAKGHLRLSHATKYLPRMTLANRRAQVRQIHRPGAVCRQRRVFRGLPEADFNLVL